MQGYNPMTPEQRRQDEWVAQNIHKPAKWHASVNWQDYKKSPDYIKAICVTASGEFD